MQTVLVIENDAANRENILRLLKFQGFRGVGAADGVVGIELAQQILPSLILCDIVMPGLDGYAVLEALGRSPLTQSIPVIFVTARAAPTEVKYALSLGVDGYLIKPFSNAELRGAIATCLDNPQRGCARVPALRAV